MGQPDQKEQKMSEFLKQFGLLILDYLIGFFVSIMMDMKHSVKYRAQEQLKKRTGFNRTEEIEYLEYKNKKYKVACNCNDFLILKEVEEIIYPTTLEPIIPPQDTDKKTDI